MSSLDEALARVHVEYRCWDCNWNYYGQYEYELPYDHAARKNHHVLIETREIEMLLPLRNGNPSVNETKED